MGYSNFLDTGPSWPTLSSPAVWGVTMGVSEMMVMGMTTAVLAAVALLATMVHNIKN